ncbi:MAG: hypothetical protein Q7T11_06225 [Deltaproteobacteria bacterium]|nr:hypothetical protein [Deltaproteobacteria bacterium]
MRSVLKIIFISFLAVATLHSAVSVCFASACPMAMEKKGCCHEALSQAGQAEKIKAACCQIGEAPAASTAFLKPEGTPSSVSPLLPVFSVTPLLHSAPLTAMGTSMPPLPGRPQKTILRI